MRRVATSLVLIPFITYIVLGAPPWAFLAVLGAVGVLCFHEYSGLVAAHGIEPSRWIGVLAGLVVMIVPQVDLALGLLALLALSLALRSADFRSVLPRAAALVLGVLYVFGAWRCAALLRWMNPHWLMFALVLNWAGDIAAYYVGRAIGRHKLAPRISPGKSWEGALGSVAGSLVAGGLYAHFLIPGVALWLPLTLSAAGNIAGQVGDLSESALKRGAGVKDSGTLLPGHGGWLDRVDSTLFAVPVIFLLLRLSQMR